MLFGAAVMVLQEVDLLLLLIVDLLIIKEKVANIFLEIITIYFNLKRN